VKNLINNIILVFIILSIITFSIILPSNLYARYEIYKEDSERFGEPGEDPRIVANPLSGNTESSEITVSSSNTYSLEEDVPYLVIHLNILLNQIVNTIL